MRAAGAPGSGPPALPSREDPVAKRRRATLANLMVPGAGLYLIGQRRTGLLLVTLFLLCFGGVITIFLTGYAAYFKVVLDPDVMQGEKLEHMADGFHLPWVLALTVGGLIVYAVAIILMIRARPEA